MEGKELQEGGLQGRMLKHHLERNEGVGGETPSALHPMCPGLFKFWLRSPSANTGS